MSWESGRYTVNYLTPKSNSMPCRRVPELLYAKVKYWDDQVLFIYCLCLQVGVVNGLVIIMLIVGVHHVVTGLTVCRTGEVAGVWSNLKHYLYYSYYYNTFQPSLWTLPSARGQLRGGEWCRHRQRPPSVSPPTSQPTSFFRNFKIQEY